MRFLLTIFGLLVPIFAHAIHYRNLSVGQEVEIAAYQTLRCLSLEVCLSGKHAFESGPLHPKPGIDMGWKDYPALMPSISIYSKVPATIISLERRASQNNSGYQWIVIRIGVLIGGETFMMTNVMFVAAGVSQYEGQNDRQIQAAFERISDFPGIQFLPATSPK